MEGKTMNVYGLSKQEIGKLIFASALAYGIVVGWFVVPVVIRTVLQTMLQSIHGI